MFDFRRVANQGSPTFDSGRNRSSNVSFCASIPQLSTERPDTKNAFKGELGYLANIISLEIRFQMVN